MTRWRNLPVFVASTFRDMHRERDMLHRLVLPRINLRLREHGVSLYLVDLRWGVSTDDRLDFVTRQRSILQTCVAEVRRCRPLFLGMLGAEYGWVPPDELRLPVVAAAGLSEPEFPLSVTAIEILSAVHAADRAEPIILARQDAPPSAESLQFRDHLAALGLHPTPYRTDNLVETAVEQLAAAVAQLITPEQPGSWLDRELATQRWIAEREAQQFVGRSAELQKVRQHWDFTRQVLAQPGGDDPGNPLWNLRHQFGTDLAVLGESGSGKSALLAKAAVDLDMAAMLQDKIETRAYVRIGATPATERLGVCVLLLLAQLDPARAAALAQQFDPGRLELDHVLGDWLDVLRTHPGDAPLVVVDGLDRIAGSLTRTEPLAWLPVSLGDRLRLLVSAADDSFEAMMLSVRPSTTVLRLGGMTRSDREDLVVSLVAAHHRELPPRVAATLAAKSSSPRWLTVATNLLMTMMANDYLMLNRLDSSLEPEVALRSLIEATAGSLLPDLRRLHGYAIDRLFEFVDDRLMAILSLISVAVHSVDDRVVEDVLTMTGDAVPAADLALFLDAFSTLVEVRNSGWQFAHQSAADAVAQIMEPDDEYPDMRPVYRRLLAKALLTRPVDDPVRSRELLPALALSGEHAALVRVLHRPELSTDEAVNIFGAVLGALAQERVLEATITGALAAASTIPEKLTLVHTTLTTAPGLAGDADWQAVVAACRDAIAGAGPKDRSRAGLSGPELDHLLTIVGGPPQLEDESWATARAIAATLTDGSASLRDLWDESAPETTTHELVTLSNQTALISEYALLVRAGLVPGSPDDPRLVAGALLRSRALLERLSDIERNRRELLDSLMSTAEQAALLAWPLPLSPVDGETTARHAAWLADASHEHELDRIRALVDRARGNADCVVALARSARVHAMRWLTDLDEDEEFTNNDYVVTQRALELLEDALFQLEVQLALTPDLVAVQIQAVQCNVQHSMQLFSAGMRASGARSGIQACARPAAIDVLGWTDYLDLATESLVAWGQLPVTFDPGPLVERLAEETDLRRSEPVRTEDETSGRLDMLVLMAALERGRRVHKFDLVVPMLRRTLDGLRSGTIVEEGAEDDPSTMELIDEYFEDLENEILDSIDEGTQPAELDQDIALAAAMTCYEARMVLYAHRGAPGDLAGAAFAAATKAWLSADPADRTRAEEALALVDQRTLDDRGNRTATAAGSLLAQGASRHKTAPGTV